MYGDPCHECGFGWTIDVDQARALVAGLPVGFAVDLSGATGEERHPQLAWSVSSYVCHVADNLMIWAERLAGVRAGAGPAIGGYDESLLAEARNYRSIPLSAARWSLARSVDIWLEAVDASRPEGTLLRHPQRGDLTLGDVVVANAHDGTHHRWDVLRTLAVSGQ